MKNLAIIITLLTPVLSFANEIKILHSDLICFDKVNKRYKYVASLTLKNISNKDLILITKTSGVGIGREYNGKPAEIFIAPGESTINGVKIIPTSEKIGLVTLRPSESTQVTKKFSSKHYIQTAILQYGATAVYNNYFKNWTGSVNSKKTNTSIQEPCKP